MRYTTHEINENWKDRGTLTPHATYLHALLYLIKRSNGYRPRGCRAEIHAEEDCGHKFLVKLYTRQSYPSVEDVISAVMHPDRTREFRIQSVDERNEAQEEHEQNAIAGEKCTQHCGYCGACS